VGAAFRQHLIEEKLKQQEAGALPAPEVKPVELEKVPEVNPDDAEE
jgi:hypothetical protein